MWNMDAPTSLPSFLLNTCILEIMVALIFGYRFAWSEDRFLVEAGLIELFDML